MKRSLATFFIVFAGTLGLSAGLRGAETAPAAEIVSVQNIWERAPHNGFTDLVRFRDRFFCCFREGLAHVGGEGIIRILSSEDGARWTEEAGVAEQGIDLREAKLTVTPDGQRLHLLGGGSIFDAQKKLVQRRTRCAFSADGRTWTPMQTLLRDGAWLWRATVNPADRKFYSIADDIHPRTGHPPSETEWSLQLYASADGLKWEEQTVFAVPGQPNQATIRFLHDGRAVALVRQDAGTRSGVIGVAAPPYRDWTWSETNKRLAGANFIELPGGVLIAGSRGFGRKATDTSVMLYRMTATGLDPLLQLPGGGNDCGYLGLLWHEGLLWVTYNATEQDRTCVFLAKVRLVSPL